jgi:hypothetical protein
MTDLKHQRIVHKLNENRRIADLERHATPLFWALWIAVYILLGCLMLS